MFVYLSLVWLLTLMLLLRLLLYSYDVAVPFSCASRRSMSFAFVPDTRRPRCLRWARRSVTRSSSSLSRSTVFKSKSIGPLAFSFFRTCWISSVTWHMKETLWTLEFLSYNWEHVRWQLSLSIIILRAGNSPQFHITWLNVENISKHH